MIIQVTTFKNSRFRFLIWSWLIVLTNQYLLHKYWSFKFNLVMCDRNYSCTSNWNTISDNFIDVAVSFLKDQVRLIDLFMKWLIDWLIDISNAIQWMFNVKPFYFTSYNIYFRKSIWQKKKRRDTHLVTPWIQVCRIFPNMNCDLF